jgi:RimJ/RimL family protein N-acetyltransferase
MPIAIPEAAQAKDLKGKFVTLRRLRANDAPLLWSAARSDAADIFRWYTYPVLTATDMEDYVAKAMKDEANGSHIGFVTIANATGEVIGSTRFLTIDRDNHSVEIGYTWIVPKFQRTAVNTEAKYLMMRTAFEDWKCRRVGLKTDSNNTKSRTAILRLGAKEEGTLRNHMVRADGSARHTVFFSVIAEEWPEVKAIFEKRLAAV